jgi:2-polyprenyl-3-methyl-5-hydroxy-6-metoxy-1,4-benzoquinol methylase
MDYESYMELYEAVYFFDKMNGCVDYKVPQSINQEKINRLGINESIYKAMMRILVVNNLIDYDGSCFVLTNENIKQLQHIRGNIMNKDPNKQYVELYNKAMNESQFFFDSISQFEYEIYSRCNFTSTFNIGKEVVKHVNVANKKVLELGGNSGGLGTALLSNNKGCIYTVVDTNIPCSVGNEFKELNEVDIAFVEGNIFELSLLSGVYDDIILMNLLHDFDDRKCLEVLRNCIKYCERDTKFLIIEDVLLGEFEPKEVVMHGLRLSVECRGGKQRTIEELESLFSSIDYRIEKTVKLNSIHTMVVMASKESQ